MPWREKGFTACGPLCKSGGKVNRGTPRSSFAPAPAQFFRLGSLKPHDPNEAYQPDTRLRLGMGLKASGVGGKTYSAGGNGS